MENKIEKVQKRDGTIVPFDQSRIEEAIFKALTATGEGERKKAKRLAKKVVQILNRRFKKGEIPHVEQIQDIVEEVLILEGLVKTAKAYILYREQRRRIREAIAVSEEAVDRLDQYIEKLDWEVQENANMAFSLQGLNHYGVTYIIKKYWLNKIYPKEIREAYESGDFHIHNLDTLGPYCMGWDLYDLLIKGFGGVPGKIESKPPKHFNTALMQCVNFLYTLQGECAGAVSFSNFDTLLAPFIRYDNLNYQQVKQALQEFLFNMAIPTRVGFQTPFSNITLDLKPSPVYAKMPVIIGGKPQDKTYSEFEEEMKIFNKALYEVYMEGDAKGRPFHFPIPTINITKDFPWEEPAFDGIFEASAKYGTNYFANYINSEMKPEDVRSMCLEANEEILIRNSKKVKRLSIKEVAENYKNGEFDKEGWVECKKEGNLEVLSLNTKTLKLEWVPVKRFLKIKDDKAVEVITEDGKISLFSLKHPVSVYTPEGIKMKFAKDLQKGDYLLALKRANENIFSNEYQKIEDLVLDEDLAKILGYFVADGNYLFENRKGYTHFGEPKGMQFTFKTGDQKNLEEIKCLIRKVFNLPTYEKQDPRYNTYYLYVYNAEIARKLYRAGFRKYGRLPQILFNSPKSVIESFLDFYFRGDGYEKRKEIHLNDLELSRDLVLLFSLIGKPVTYKIRKKSQTIYLQHANSKIKKGIGWLNNPILAERVPGWMAVSTAKVPGLRKSRMVGLNTLEKYNAHTEESLKIKNSDIYLVRVKEIKIRRYKRLKEFYDIELERNHLFVHSLGQISFNCCRLRLDLTELYNRGGGGLFGAGAKTGSLGVVTINLPRIGYLSKTKKEFFERLAMIMDLTKESLEIKRKVLENYIEKGLYPYSRYYLQDIKQMRGKYWANHFSTIGLVGMNECLLNFMGENIASKRGRKFTLEVLDFMRERLVKYQKETGNIYNLEATPAESTAYRLALKDKERYPDIITAGTQKVHYYTNSTQLPVNYTDDVFEALRLQDEIQCKYTGGTVFHIFLGERMQNGEGVKKMVKKIFENFKLPYITITPTFSICPVHGYIPGEHFFCPKCTIKQPCEVYSRIVGYYRPVQQWNLGKQQEFKQRKEFKIKEAALK
jgi:ribonucleoside-triphosphate reductase